MNGVATKKLPLSTNWKSYQKVYVKRSKLKWEMSKSQRANNLTKKPPPYTAEKKLWRHWHCENVCFIFILLASPKKKQTNRKKECWQGHCNSCGQLQRARILIKEMKTRNIKKCSDTRKSTATYNKLLHETRDEHYYILNR